MEGQPLHEGPERARDLETPMRKEAKVKPGSNWRSLDVRGARALGSLPRRPECKECYCYLSSTLPLSGQKTALAECSSTHT